MSNQRSRLAICLVILLSAVSAVFAQEEKSARVEDSSIVTATVTSDRVRVSAPSTVVQLRLEVYDEAGRKLLDTEQRGGNVLDWHLQEATGQKVLDGAYLSVVTVKSLSGRLTQKLGFITVSGQSAVAVRASSVAELNQRQAQAVGPVEAGGEGLTIIAAEEAQAQPATVLAHDGNDAQLSRTRGALTFRIGNFFSGTDREQMRLTEDGKLGIGTDNPQATLDVAGSIRTSKGVEFADGTVQTTGLSGRKDANGNVVPNAAGAGTQNRIAKWTDNAGTLGDSLLNETGTGIEVRSPGAGSGVNPSIQNPNNLPGFAQFQFYPVSGPNSNMSFTVVPRGAGAANNRAQFSIFGTDLFADPTNYEFASLRARDTDFVLGSGKSGSGQTRPFMIASGFLNDNTTNNGQLYLATNGNVGVGTTSPNTKLDVAGNVNTSTQYNIGGNRVLGNAGTDNLFAGVGTGGANTGSSNSFVGVRAGIVSTTGVSNSFFGADAGARNTQGSANTFVGQQAGFNNTSGAGNLFVGRGVGFSNTTGTANTFFSGGGTNTIGSYNTLVGANTDVGSNNLDHAAAIGADAVVTTSNTIMLGRSDRSDKVIVPGNLTTLGTLSAYTVDAETQFTIGGAHMLSIGDNSSESLFFGDGSGELDATGTRNTLLGGHTNFGGSNLTNATAVGYRAMVSQSNSLVLGSINGANGATADTNVGIGTTVPVNILHLNGNHNDFALTFTNQANTAGRRGYRIAFDSDRLTFQSATDSGAFAANQMAIDQATGNVGIGTTSPHAKLQVAGGNIYVTNPNGVILSAPNGTCWQIGVSNAGALTTIATPCP